MKKLVVLLALLASIAVLSTFEAHAQVKEGEESEILFRKKWNEFDIQGNILNAIFTPDESKILLSAEDKFLELDANTGNVIREIPGVFGAWQFSDDGQYFYSYDRKKIKYPSMEIIGLYTDSITGNWPMTGFAVNEKAGLFIGYILQSSSTPLIENSIYIYDEKTFELKKITGIMGHQIYDLQISPNGDYFVTSSRYDPDKYHTGDEKYIFTKWDTKTLKIIDSREEFATAKKFSPDGKWIGATLYNKVALYDAQTLNKQWEKKQQDSAYGLLTAIAFSKDSKYLATGGPDYDDVSNIHVWNVDNGNLEKRYFEIGGTPQQKIEFNSNYRILSSHQSVIALFGSKFKSVIELEEKINQVRSEGNKLFLHLYKTDPSPTNIELYNSTGARISALFNGINQIEYVFDISKLSKGIYFLNIKINNEIFSEKFIKE